MLKSPSIEVITVARGCLQPSRAHSPWDSPVIKWRAAVERPPSRVIVCKDWQSTEGPTDKHTLLCERSLSLRKIPRRQPGSFARQSLLQKKESY